MSVKGITPKKPNQTSEFTKASGGTVKHPNIVLKTPEDVGKTLTIGVVAVEGEEVNGIDVPVQLESREFLCEIGRGLEFEMDGSVVYSTVQNGLLVGDGAVDVEIVVSVVADGGGMDLRCKASVGAMDVEAGAFDDEVGGGRTPLCAILQDIAKIEGLCTQVEVVVGSGC